MIPYLPVKNTRHHWRALRKNRLVLYILLYLHYSFFHHAIAATSLSESSVTLAMKALSIPSARIFPANPVVKRADRVYVFPGL